MKPNWQTKIPNTIYGDNKAYLEGLLNMMTSNNPAEASTLTDEQLRVLAAEADGWKHRLATQENPVERDGCCLPNSFGDNPKEPIEAWWRDGLPGVFARPFHYLADANAAIGLLKGKVWSSHTSGSETSISVDCIQVEDGIVAATVSGSDVPAFCRAVVLAVLRAEGKIL